MTDIQARANAQSFPFSTSAIYSVTFNSSTLSGSDCRDEICDYTLGFDYFRADDCQLRMICTHLEQDVCASHGLELSETSNDGNTQESQQQVCFKNKIYEGKLTQGNSIKLGLWYQLGSTFQARCYLWCTRNGELPADGSDASLSDEILIELVFITTAHLS